MSSSAGVDVPQPLRCGSHDWDEKTFPLRHQFYSGRQGVPGTETMLVDVPHQHLIFCFSVRAWLHSKRVCFDQQRSIFPFFHFRSFSALFYQNSIGKVWRKEEKYEDQIRPAESTALLVPSVSKSVKLKYTRKREGRPNIAKRHIPTKGPFRLSSRWRFNTLFHAD